MTDSESSRIFLGCHRHSASQGLGKGTSEILAQNLLSFKVSFERQKTDMRKHISNSKPNTAKENWLKGGAALFKDNRYLEAISYYGDATKLFPTDYHLLYCKGVAHHHGQQLIEAIGCYSNALQFKPDFVEAFENLAEAQADLLMFDDALLSIQAAIAFKPKKSLSQVCLARILTRLGNYDEAVNVATFAINLDPTYPNAYTIRSSAYRQLNCLQESIADLRTAISLDPKNPNLVYNLAFDLLLGEQFKEGWQCYESRFLTTDFLKNVPEMVSPLWDGQEDLVNKTILVCPEQGLGDQIQFGRYALFLKNLGAQVIMPVYPSLVEIMKSMSPDIVVTSSMQSASDMPKHDFHVPLMSLMGIFNTHLDNIPKADRYLSPNLAISSKWSERFKQKSKLQIGITWSGSQMHVNDHNRSMALVQLQALFDLDADWHLLQTEVRASDEALLAKLPIKDWRSELTSMQETAGLLDQIDLLITVDTSVAHLSAALGKPTWIMLPFAPDYRWLLNRNDSPWYPTVQLFRQPKPRDWDSVVAEIIETLTKP